MKKLALFVVIFMILIIGGVCPSSAETSTFSQHYSVVYNPCDSYSYGWEQNLGGNFNLYDSVRNGIQWYDSNHHSGDFTPTIWVNNTGSTSYGVPHGNVSLHPGWDESLSVVRWVSPSAETISISGFFGAGDSGSMSYYILLNGHTIFSKYNDAIQENFSFSGLTLAKGSTLDFAVGTGSGGYGFGNTPFDVTITSSATATPISGIVWLLGPGLVGLAGLRRKFKM